MRGTASGAHLERTVRRLCAADQVAQDLMATMQGTPWDRKIGQIGRPKREIIVAKPPPTVTDERAGDEAKKKDQGPTIEEVPDVTVEAGLADGLPLPSAADVPVPGTPTRGEKRGIEFDIFTPATAGLNKKGGGSQRSPMQPRGQARRERIHLQPHRPQVRRRRRGSELTKKMG